MALKQNAWDLVSADDPTDWKDGFSFMRALDATLRCELCYDIFTAPVSIKDCNHTFCSACVRSAINKPGEEMGSRCPRCMNKNVYDSSLIPQRALEQAAQQWRLARPQLYAKQVREQQQEEQQAEAMAKAATRKRPRSGSASPTVSRKDDDCPSQAAGGPSTHKTDQSFTNGLRRSARSTSRRLPPFVVHDSSEEEAVEEEFEEANGYGEVDGSSPVNATATATKDYRSMEANDLLACPICQHTFTMRMLNVHLDKGACKAGDPEPSPQERGLPYRNLPGGVAKAEQSAVASTSSPSNGSWFKRPVNAQQNNGPPRKKLVRLNYDMVKPVDLKRALDEWRLSTTGERKRLVERHRYWVNLFNANLDASEKMRKSETALRQELQAWERAQDEAVRGSGAFTVSEKRVKTWTQDHKDEFSRLAAQARQSHLRDRQKHDAESVRSVTTEEKHRDDSGKVEEADDVV